MRTSSVIRARDRVCILVSSVAAAALTASLLTLALPAEAATSTRLNPVANPSASAVSAQPRAGAASAGNCAAAIDESIRNPERIVPCIIVGSPADVAPTRASAQPGGVSSPGNASATSCVTTRTRICITDGVFALVEIAGGAQVGKTTWDYTQVITMSAKSLPWTETDTATLASTSGDTILAVNSLGWTVNCSGGCSPASALFWPVTPMVIGDTLSGTATFSGTPASGDVASLKATPAVIMCSTAGNPVCLSPFNLASRNVRCDNGVAVSNTSGCINPAYTPNLSVSQASFGAAAQMISFGQTSSQIGSPLHALTNPIAQEDNRNTICNSTFGPGTTGVINDSCDEYAFAATYESGALHGVNNGASCAQVTAVRTSTTGSVAQQWGAIRVISLGDGKCVRGHIPLSLNTGVGGALGNFTIANRLIDKDPYTVSVTG